MWIFENSITESLELLIIGCRFFKIIDYYKMCLDFNYVNA